MRYKINFYIIVGTFCLITLYAISILECLVATKRATCIKGQMPPLEPITESCNSLIHSTGLLEG